MERYRRVIIKRRKIIFIFLLLYDIIYTTWGGYMFGIELLPLDDENNKRIRYSKLLINNNIKRLEDNTINKEYNYKKIFPSKYKRGEQEKINTLKAYKYILENKSINKETIKELYDLISNDLLDDNLELKDNYYRDQNVCIINGKYDYEYAMPPEYVEDKMNKLIEYININNCNNEIEEFIKSQIIHFYLVYIHPYYDCNGRTARTLSMWYLLNKNLDKYLISNRVIVKNKEEYLNAIRKGRHSKNITKYLNFILEGTLNELNISEKPKIKLKK